MCDIISTTVISNRLLEAFLWMLAAFLYHDDPTLLSGGQSLNDSVFYSCFHCIGGAFGITAEKQSCCQADSFQMVLDGGSWDSLPEERLLLPLRPFRASASTSALIGSYFNSTLTPYAPVPLDSLKCSTL